MSKKLETMDAQPLMTTPMEPLRFIVSRLILQGRHILAGAPKVGKSWLALWICLQAAKDEAVWGFETRKCEVLYLCLENGLARIQNRTENTAALICTGRDIESRELFLGFNKDTFLWELLQPIEEAEQKVDEAIFLLSDFMKSAVVFTGTATELAERLKLFSGTDCPPAVLKKKIIKHMEYLQRNSISYSDQRSFERREFTLRYDGNDGMTVENAPTNLPSLPSQPSGDE
ncbi:AAA family ATPase [Oscillibacter sp.]|uniref:AAA family ATPase n=1 Tax=Oscillibacter sp. TaxID=1945593 RepID=UPI00289785C3|nr:AAA family ATPase [Oscillibacter sp.]